MKVLVTFAVEAEFAPWRKLRTLEQTTIEGLVFFHTQIGRAGVDFIVTGMGEESARRCTEIALAKEYTICIASGFAGSLKESLAVGDVVVARAVQKLGKSKTLECSRNLYMAGRELKAADAKMFLTTDHVVATAEEKKQLSPFADAIDMESFATLSVAKIRKLPAVVIRVISDSMEDDMPADIDKTVDERGRVKVGRVIRHLATHPLQIPELMRLGKSSKTSAKVLAGFLEAYIKHISFREHGWPPFELTEVAAVQ